MAHGQSIQTKIAIVKARGDEGVDTDFSRYGDEAVSYTDNNVEVTTCIFADVK